MSAIFDAYDLDLDELIGLYRRLNRPIPYPDGMVTSLGILYWGKDEHLPALEAAIPPLKAAGLRRMSHLLESIRTPGRMAKLSQASGISPATLRVLKHDLELWLPRPLPLAEMEPLQAYAACFEPLAAEGIRDQLQMISAGQSAQSRESLSQRTGIPLETLVALLKRCDLYRLGSNLKHIRAQIYFDMGLDTWQKWVGATSEDILRRFGEYVNQHDLAAVRLVPWPKEARNGIEWAREHLRIFAVEW